jgi:hypothetical protein
MEFESKELNNALFVRPNSTHVSVDGVDSKDLKDQIKISLILKDKKLIKWYEMYSMREYKNVSALETLIYLIRSLRDEFISEHKDDNVKNLTIRRSFDNILLSLDLMLINKLDISSDILNTIFLSFLSKNFI